MALDDLRRGIRDVARRRADRGPGEATLRARAGGAAAGDPQAPAVRAGIAALLRGESPARMNGSGPASAGGREAVLALPGAREVEIGGACTVEVRRRLEELLPGEDVAGQVEGALARLAGADPEGVYAGLRPAIGARPEDLAVLDLETTGFWGCPVFLVGLLVREGGEWVTRQLLACDYPDEPAMLRAAAHLLEERNLLVTFNGKSYDVPCFSERCGMFGVRTTLAGRRHVDVLHASRRRWRGELTDCRLQTLERQVTLLSRQGDVPSADIPGLYHDFAASGDPEELEPVLHHGRVDVLTTLRLFAKLAADPPPPPPKPKRKRRPRAAAGGSAP